jgi:hypothetical protein
MVYFKNKPGIKMTDSALVNASRERDEIAAKINQLQAKIDEWRKEIARIDRFIADWHEFAHRSLAGVSGAGSSRIVDNTAVESGGKTKTTGNSDKEEVGKAAREIVLKQGAPVARPVMLTRLRDRGLVIEGASPETVLSTMLWRVKETAGLIYLKKRGYWVTELPFPDAGYDPADAKSELFEIRGPA